MSLVSIRDGACLLSQLEEVFGKHLFLLVPSVYKITIKFKGIEMLEYIMTFFNISHFLKIYISPTLLISSFLFVCVYFSVFFCLSLLSFFQPLFFLCLTLSLSLSLLPLIYFLVPRVWFSWRPTQRPQSPTHTLLFLSICRIYLCAFVFHLFLSFCVASFHFFPSIYFFLFHSFPSLLI